MQNNNNNNYSYEPYCESQDTASDDKQITERAIAIIATKQEEIAVKQEQREHLMRMAAFWHECEVSLPNKLVAVPRSQFKFRPATGAANIDERLLLKSVKSFNTENSASTAQDSSSSGSGSQRSSGDELSLLLQTTNKTTTTTKTTIEEREEDRDCDRGCDVDQQVVGAAVAKPPAPEPQAACEAF